MHVSVHCRWQTCGIVWYWLRVVRKVDSDCRRFIYCCSCSDHRLQGLPLCLSVCLRLSVWLSHAGYIHLRSQKLHFYQFSSFVSNKLIFRYIWTSGNLRYLLRCNHKGWTDTKLQIYSGQALERQKQTEISQTIQTCSRPVSQHLIHSK